MIALRKRNMIAFFKLLASRIWPLLKPMLIQFSTHIGAEVLEVATGAVNQVAKDPSILTNAARREQALKYVSSDLQQRGYEIGRDVKESLINLAIETAVQNLKAA